MAIDFPNSPTNGQTYTVGSRTWTYDSANGVWNATSSTLGPQGVQGLTGLQGTQGITGSGTQGTQGITGSGTQGTQGITGLQGSSGQATVYRWTKTAVGAETSLSGNDNNSIALTYTVNQELLHINGVLQVRGTDYIATTGTTITNLTALANGDIIDIWSPNSFNVANTYTTTETNALLAQLPSDAKVYFMKG